MAKILVLYYSSYGHTETMAQSVARGAREAGGQVALRRVPELTPEDVAKSAGYKLDQDAPMASVREVADYDAIIVGTPTHFGNMTAQMKNFLDQCGDHWYQDKLVGKIGSAFTCTASQHGGQESTILSIHVTLMHLGMIVVGLPYTFKGQLRMDEVSGGTPYGATTMTSLEGRQPTANELEGAVFQGRHVAQVTTALIRGRQVREPAMA